MKKNILYLCASILFTAYGYQSKTQTTLDSLKPIMKDIKGNIVLMGIIHSGALYEEINGHQQKASLIGDTSRRIFCSVYPELVKASKGKRMIFLIEGLKPNVGVTLNANVVKDLKLPDCLPLSDTLVGCDPRSDSMKIQLMNVYLSTNFEDGLNGTEKTFEEAFLKPSTLDLSKLDSSDVSYVYYYGKLAGKDNDAFEKTIIKMAGVLEKQGHFVVVICGAAHVVKIIAEQKREDIGYVLCLTSTNKLRGMMSMAKFLSALEKFAYTK